jgi:hypothetical protein
MSCNSLAGVGHNATSEVAAHQQVPALQGLRTGCYNSLGRVDVSKHPFTLQAGARAPSLCSATMSVITGRLRVPHHAYIYRPHRQ